MALFERAIQRGLHADRPAPGAPGACYFESDTGHGYRDSGTSWELITGISTGDPSWSVQHVTADTTLTVANVLVYTEAAGGDFTLSLPQVSSVPNQAIQIRNNANVSVTLAPFSGDALDDPGDNVMGIFSNTAFRCDDGTTWYRTL